MRKSRHSPSILSLVWVLVCKGSSDLNHDAPLRRLCQVSNLYHLLHRGNAGTVFYHALERFDTPADQPRHHKAFNPQAMAQNYAPMDFLYLCNHLCNRQSCQQQHLAVLTRDEQHDELAFALHAW